MNFLDIVQKRRSVRKYSDQPVEEEKLTYILECARLAPSWKNLQCWHFFIVKDASLREALAEAMTPNNPGRKALAQAPVVIVLCADPEQAEVWEGKDYMMLDAGLAMEHLVLAATEQGLGTCWEGWFSEEEIRKVLNIPEGLRIVALTPLGYPAEEKPPRPRKSMEEIVTWLD